jgi:hypothetical protein
MFKAMGPRVNEGERRMGTNGDGNAISSRSHLVVIGKGDEGNDSGRRCPH